MQETSQVQEIQHAVKARPTWKYLAQVAMFSSSNSSLRSSMCEENSGSPFALVGEISLR